MCVPDTTPPPDRTAAQTSLRSGRSGPEGTCEVYDEAPAIGGATGSRSAEEGMGAESVAAQPR